MNPEAYSAIILVILLPLFGSILQTLIGWGMSKNSPGLRKLAGGIVACGATFAAFIIGAVHHFNLLAEQGTVKAAQIHYADWIKVAGLNLPLELRFDALSSTMVLVVTGIGTLIHIFATKYMEEDRDFNRFFAYLNLFVAMMLILVLGGNLALLFVGWEGVGVCSYLLIGFWHQEQANANAANKAFITNRIGDVGLALGMFWLVSLLAANRNSLEISDDRWLSYDVLLPAAGDLLSLFPAAATGIALLLFLGAMGKSAQFPLYVWLPDAMAGPTPVSALIHAATMVTSGVVLLSRVSEIIILSPIAMTVITVVGALTALIGAIIAWGQTDIKKVLAYSTVSQLGYMFIACGVGAFYAGMFHVVTHAFFKALLFLGSGSVIYAMAHDQDMRNYGALRKKMPVTFGVMMMGYLAIAGLPLFVGFWSKEAILSPAVNDGSTTLLIPGTAFTYGAVAGWIGFAVAFMTAFYMTRMMILTFFGKEERWRSIEPEHHHDGHAHHEDHGHDHSHGHEMDPGFFMTEAEAAHGQGHDGHHHALDKTHEPKETPRIMYGPLIPLALASTFVIGLLMYGNPLNPPHPHPFEGFLHSAEVVTAHDGKVAGGVAGAHSEEHGDEHSEGGAAHAEEGKKKKAVETPVLIAVSLGTFILGVGLAWLRYRNGLPSSEGFDLSKWNPVQKAAGRQLGLNWLLARQANNATIEIGKVFKGFDKGVIDGVLVEGPPKAVGLIGGFASILQSGFVRGYAAVMQLGIIAFIVYAAWMFSQGGGK